VENKPLPVYGKGENIRDWLYVEDHAEAIDLILHRGKIGETYAIGGNNEMKNIDMVHNLIESQIELLGRKEGTPLKDLFDLLQIVWVMIFDTLLMQVK